MSDALLGGVLPAIFSAGDYAKRRLKSLTTDPIADIQQSLGQLTDTRRQFEDLHRMAYGDPSNPARVTNPKAAQMLLLVALASSPNRPVSRDNLLARARGRDHDALDRSIDVQVLRLRQIIEDDPSKPRFIKTVWGVGYMLVADVDS